MNVVACYKIVPDAQDIAINADGSLDLSRAQDVIGEYDLVAIEEAVRIAEETGGRAVLLSAGGSEVTESKMVKAALSRGAEELFCVVDDAMKDADSYQTAVVLAQALEKMEYDVVVCGEGSSDLYAQQVGSLLGTLINAPVLNAVSSVSIEDGALKIERTLENEVEVLKVQTPAVISVTTDINLPRIPQLKDILAAGKKPVTTWSIADVGTLPASNIEVVSTLAPESIDRKHVMYEDTSDESIQKLALDIKTAK